jgi:NADH:ubiquinone oxidoreductase subunit 5 (subunit L)/multisubunit Na+/H+ antiporter MnhA subunit
MNITTITQNINNLYNKFFFSINNYIDSLLLEINIFSILLLFTISLVILTSGSYFKNIKESGILNIILFTLGLLFFILLLKFNSIILEKKYEEIYFKININNWNNLPIDFSLKIDGLSYFFMLLVVGIGFASNIYTLNYFKHEKNTELFILQLNWFIISMLILVTANSLFSLIVGWELIGLTSFLLINFWNTRKGTTKSAFKAFTANKLSDFFLFIAIIIIWNQYHISNITTLNYEILTNPLPYNNNLLWSGIFFILCASLKSAQIIGHIWLPDSMEAPVPASALIHSATLVSAGIYLLLRFKLLFEITNLTTVIIYLGSITAAYGGITSAAQTDMKKLLAYSTISHCGFLFVCCALGHDQVTIIYLYLHGIFKAMTFFCAGSFIRVANSQDTRQMGILGKILPIDSIYLIISICNLAGLPFSFGYLYKQVFFNTLVLENTPILCVGFLFIGMLCSLIYTYRLVYYSIFDFNKNTNLDYIIDLQQVNEQNNNNWSLTTYTQILAFNILLLFTVICYILFSQILLNSLITLDHYPIIINVMPSLTTHVKLIYINYYEFFYSAYIFVILIISLIVYRSEFTFYKNTHFILTIVITCLFFTILLKLKYLIF